MCRNLGLVIGFVALTGAAGCGGQQQHLNQAESLDIVECSLAGWGTRNLPRKTCEEQGGLSLTARPYQGPGPYGGPGTGTSRPPAS